jgi:nicotinamidase/pyrazinamidase
MTTHPSVPGKQLPQILWPVHCVQNTPGADFVEGLDLREVKVFIEKGQEKLVESYSAFTDPWGLFPSKLEEALLEGGIKRVFVVGLGMFTEGRGLM